MKSFSIKFLIVILSLFYTSTLFGQTDIDVEILSEIIGKKQKELQKRVLFNIVSKRVETSNYATYNTLYWSMEILLTEKNSEIISAKLIDQIGLFTLTHELVKDYMNRYPMSFENLSLKKGDSTIQNSLTFHKAFSIKLDSSDVRLRKDRSKVLMAETSEANKWTNFLIDTCYQRLYLMLVKNGKIEEDLQRKYFEDGIGKEFDYENKVDDDVKQIFKDLESKYFNGNDWKDDNIPEFYNKYSEVMDFQGSVVSDRNLKAVKNTLTDIIKEYQTQVQNETFVKILDILKEYLILTAIINNDRPTSFSYKVDWEGAILALEDEFTNARLTSLEHTFVGVKPYFLIGLNYGVFANELTIKVNETFTDTLNQLAFASEKFGLKFILADFEYTRSFGPNQSFKYRGTWRYWDNYAPSKPLINNIYFHLFGSGLIYNIVNLKTNRNFELPLIGVGFGVEFFNSLEANVNYSLPLDLNDDPIILPKRGMLSIGFDVPIFEYLSEVGQGD
ncbi:MAG: hypothetical protein WD077_02105 [Bacteroidia bacterium]